MTSTTTTKEKGRDREENRSGGADGVGSSSYKIVRTARPQSSGNHNAIASALGLIADPDGIFEVRALGVKQGYGAPKLMSGYWKYQQIDAAAEAISKLDSGSIYMTLNPPIDRLLAKSNAKMKVAVSGGTTPDKYIKSRRWILIDVDPHRPSDIPSTTEEHEASREMARRIRTDLLSMGFPEPIAIDSGNGTYLLYRINEPADDAGLCERFLQGLSDRYTVPDVMKVDTTTFNPARIMRVPGTTNKKGDEVPDMDMEHRPCVILSVPEAIGVVSRELLESIAVDVPVKTSQTKPKPASSHQADGAQSWIKEWVSKHAGALPSHSGWRTWNKGGEILVFDSCPFDASHDNASACITVSHGGGIAFKCHHDSCKSNNWRLLRERIEGPRQHDGGVDVDPEPWRDIIPFGKSAEETPFPDEVLPDVFRDYVRSVAESRQVPTDLPSMLVLGMVSMASAKIRKVQVGTTHQESLNIYVLSLLEPGERKSQVFKDCTFPADEVERLLVERARPEIARIKAHNAVYRARINALQKNAEKAPPEEYSGLIEQCAELQSQLMPEPMPPALMVGDVTPEYLSKVMERNYGRIAQVDAEGGTFFKVISGRYEKNNDGNFEIYLKGHSGDTHRSGRISRDGELIHDPALTLLMVGQPELLRGIGNVRELIGRGLLGRMLITFPTTKVGHRSYRDVPIDVAIRNRYHGIITDMLLEPVPEVEHVLHIRGEALEVWREVHDATEADMKEGARLAHIRSWAQKYAGHVARIAGLLHIMRGGRGDNIESKDVIGAACIGDYLQAHALSAFQAIGGRDDMLAERLLEWIKRHRHDRFEEADAYRGLRRGVDVQRPSDLSPAVHELERRGYIRLIPLNPRKSAGRPPSPTYEVNPAVWREVDRG